jgi:DNA polymerase I-like protein with 3'-5' exonuclease and polymerase domains
VRCAVPGDPKPTPQQIRCCAPFVQADIADAAPTLVLLLGDAALRGVLGRSGITKYHGQPVTQEGRTYLPVYHPGYVQQDPRYEKDLLQDLARARELYQTLESGRSQVDRLRGRYQVLSTPAEVAEGLRFLRTQPLLAYDSEYCPLDPFDPSYRVLGVSFSWAPRTGVFIPLEHPESPFRGDLALRAAVAELLESVPLWVHNAPVDVRAAEWLGACWWKLTIVLETMLASGAVRGPEAIHRLKHLAVTYADTVGYEEELEAFKQRSLEVRAILQAAQHPTKTHPCPPPEIVAAARDFVARWHGRLYDGAGYDTIPLSLLASPYATGDTDTTWQVGLALQQALQDRGQWAWYQLFGLPAWKANYAMHRRGLLIDWDAWRARACHWAAQQQAAHATLLTLPPVQEFAAGIAQQGKEFNPGSGDQKRALLFGVYRLPPPTFPHPKTRELHPKYTPGGQLSLDKEVLARLLEEHDDCPVIPGLRAYTRAESLRSTLEGMARRMGPDGRIHPQYLSISRSGRRRSKDPNVQNITKGHPDDPLSNLRCCLTAGPGRHYVSPDWGQLEFRLAACESRDPNMLTCCRDQDPHQLLASRLQLPRGPTKTVNFGMIYGGSAATLCSRVYQQTGLRWTLDFGQQVVNETKAAYAVLFQHIAAVHQQILAQGWIANVFGNRRDFPHARQSTDPALRERALREGWNHKIQPTGHDLLNCVISVLLQLIQTEERDWHLENELHDQFLLSVPEADVLPAARIIDHLMTQIPIALLGEWLQVPLPVEIAVGPSYGDLVPLSPDDLAHSLQDAPSATPDTRG